MLHVQLGQWIGFGRVQKREGDERGEKILKHIEDVCYGIFTIFISCVHLLL